MTTDTTIKFNHATLTVGRYTKRLTSLGREFKNVEDAAKHIMEELRRFEAEVREARRARRARAFILTVCYALFAMGVQL